jgi:hypothetical protein
MQIKYLCVLFGAKPSVCSSDVHHMLNVFPCELCNHAFSQIMFPDEEKKAEYASMIESWEPLAHDVSDLMDGSSLPSKCTSETLDQNVLHTLIPL